MKVYINDVTKVKKVCDVCSKYADEVFAVSEKGYRVNAKSLMGLLSLDLSKEIELIIDTYKNSVERGFERSIKNVLGGE